MLIINFNVNNNMKKLIFIFLIIIKFLIILHLINIRNLKKINFITNN